MAKNYVQVVSTNKEYRDIALDWLTSNVEGQPVKARATLTLPDGAVFEVLHVSNDKSCLALKPIQPAFSCIWFIPKPGIERSVQVTNVSRTKAQ